MGCQICRGNEQENQLDYGRLRESKPSNRIMVDPPNCPQTEYENFIKSFDQNLQLMGGHYISVSDFDILIPEGAHKIMTEKTFDISQYPTNLKKNYETKPVEFLNGCIYHGGWNDNFQMEGYGKFYLKNENVFA